MVDGKEVGAGLLGAVGEDRSRLQTIFHLTSPKFLKDMDSGLHTARRVSSDQKSETQTGETLCARAAEDLNPDGSDVGGSRERWAYGAGRGGARVSCCGGV